MAEQLGLGVMLGILGGNRSSVEAWNRAVGRKIAAAMLKDDALHLTMEDGFKIKFADEGQSCCEHRYMTCGDDLAGFVGATLLDGETAPAPNLGTEDDVHEVAFLRLKTDRGVIVCETHNKHNGYYGGFYVVASEVTP